MTVGLSEHYSGRQFWSSFTEQCLVGKLQDNPNSLCVIDRWSLGHVAHGLLFHLLLELLACVLKKKPAGLFGVVIVEAAWEIFENSGWCVDRFRARGTKGYLGDSLVNSFGDITCCILGYALAQRLTTHSTIFLIVAFEVLTYAVAGESVFTMFINLMR